MGGTPSKHSPPTLHLPTIPKLLGREMDTNPQILNEFGKTMRNLIQGKTVGLDRLTIDIFKNGGEDADNMQSLEHREQQTTQAYL